MAKIPGIAPKYIKVEYKYFHGERCPSFFPKNPAINAMTGRPIKKNKRVVGLSEHDWKNSPKVILVKLFNQR